MDKPKCWVKNVISNFQLSTLDCIFNPTFGFVHIRPKFGFKQPSIFRSVDLFFMLVNEVHESLKLNRNADAVFSVFFLSDSLQTLLLNAHPNENLHIL